jgi:hypothetical protein
LPIAEENRFDNLTVLSIAPLLARAIKEVFEDGSVTSLFDGHSQSSNLTFKLKFVLFHHLPLTYGLKVPRGIKPLSREK